MSDTPEQKPSELPPDLSPEEQEAHDKAARKKKIVGTCAFVGMLTFAFLNKLTHVVPGGAIGGALGGGIGAAVGMAINAIRYP